MMASLYQSGSSGRARRGVALLVILSDPLQKIIKVPFTPNLFPHPKDLGRHHPGIELHVVPFSLPQVPGIAQQVVDLIRAIPFQSHLLQGELHPPGLKRDGDPD